MNVITNIYLLRKSTLNTCLDLIFTFFPLYLFLLLNLKEDDMGFGKPTRYWSLYREDIKSTVWDSAVLDASEEYKNRMVSFV